jgi:hypothetical protein
VVDLFLDPCALPPPRAQAQLTRSHNVHAMEPCPQMYPADQEHQHICNRLHCHLPTCALSTDVGLIQNPTSDSRCVMAPAAQRYQALQPKRQRLVAMVCYYGKHYMAFVLVRLVTCCCPGGSTSCSVDHRNWLCCCSRCV